MKLTYKIIIGISVIFGIIGALLVHDNAIGIYLEYFPYMLLFYIGIGLIAGAVFAIGYTIGYNSCEKEKQLEEESV